MEKPSLPFQIVVCSILGGVVTALVVHGLAPTLQKMISGDPTLLGAECTAAGLTVGALIPIIRHCLGKTNGSSQVD